MPVDTATSIGGFDTAKPSGADSRTEADDNFRHIKTVLKNNFGAITGNVTATHTELNYVSGVTSAIQTQLDAKAPTASPTFTGVPAAPTATAGTSSTQIATTAFVSVAIAGVNAQTALTTSIDASASVSLSVGQHVVCTNASAVTATLPPSPASGDRCRVTFSNTLYSNVISPGSLKIFGATGTRTVNAKNASPEFIYTNSSIGWVY